MCENANTLLDKVFKDVSKIDRNDFSWRMFGVNSNMDLSELSKANDKELKALQY